MPNKKANNQEVLLKQILESLQNSQTSQIPEVCDVAVRPFKQNKVYPFRQTLQGSVVTTALVESDVALSYSLNSIPNGSNFAAIFDRWRIAQIRVCFLPIVLPSTTVAEGPIYTAIDLDDASTRNINNLNQYQTLKIAPVGSYFERTFTPRAAIAADGAGVFTSFAQASTKTWMDTASPGIIYFGLKYAIPGSTTSGTPLWNVNVVLDFEFSQVI
jgi:hypothetical protein